MMVIDKTVEFIPFTELVEILNDSLVQDSELEKLKNMVTSDIPAPKVNTVYNSLSSQIGQG